MPLDVIHRYRPVIDVLQDEVRVPPSDIILEVGSGSGGIADYCTHFKNVNCDIQFECNRLGHVRYVRGSSARLPFKDKSCRWLISIDMLEHIEEAERSAVLRECMRVASAGFIIGFPSGERGRRYEKAFARLYELFGIRHVWLQEHFKYDVLEAEDILARIKRICPPQTSIRMMKNVNVGVWFISMIVSIPLLLIGRVCRISLRQYMRMFGWTSRYVNFGVCYRTILICRLPSADFAQSS